MKWQHLFQRVSLREELEGSGLAAVHQYVTALGGSSEPVAWAGAAHGGARQPPGEDRDSGLDLVFPPVERLGQGGERASRREPAESLFCSLCQMCFLDEPMFEDVDPERALPPPDAQYVPDIARAVTFAQPTAAMQPLECYPHGKEAASPPGAATGGGRERPL